jgi:hypothetical protein
MRDGFGRGAPSGRELATSITTTTLIQIYYYYDGGIFIFIVEEETRGGSRKIRLGDILRQIHY